MTNSEPLHIDIPVKLAEVKTVFSIGALAFEDPFGQRPSVETPVVDIAPCSWTLTFAQASLSVSWVRPHLGGRGDSAASCWPKPILVVVPRA